MGGLDCSHQTLAVCSVLNERRGTGRRGVGGALALLLSSTPSRGSRNHLAQRKGGMFSLKRVLSRDRVRASESCLGLGDKGGEEGARTAQIPHTRFRELPRLWFRVSFCLNKATENHGTSSQTVSHRQKWRFGKMATAAETTRPVRGSVGT